MTLYEWAVKEPDDERKINYETQSGLKFTSEDFSPYPLFLLRDAKIIERSIKNNEHYILLDI